MTPKSAKAKGRRLAMEFADAVRDRLELPLEDVRVTPAGVNGSDLTLSARATEVFPFDVESKNVERLNIWDALDQVTKRSDKLSPLVVFSRNRSDMFVALRADDFLDLVEVRAYGRNR
jgi:hypothetical protein